MDSQKNNKKRELDAAVHHWSTQFLRCYHGEATVIMNLIRCGNTRPGGRGGRTSLQEKELLEEPYHDWKASGTKSGMSKMFGVIDKTYIEFKGIRFTDPFGIPPMDRK